MSSSWSVYILRCADGTLYTGIAMDVLKRFGEHQSQGPRAAKYVRGRAPLELVYSCQFPSRAEAAREEWRIKQLSRTEKLELIVANSR